MIDKRVQANFKMLTAATIMVVLLASACNDPEDGLGEPEIGAVVVTQRNDSTELFLEYSHVVAGKQTGNWAIHLTDMDDFQPIRSGTMVSR